SNMNSWRVDLPEPPARVETRPGTPPDDPNAVWVPGGWEDRSERWMWRAGYWAHPNGNQVWQPGQYVPTDHRFAYVPGCWYYALEERGLLYAPVYFTDPLWLNPGWAFSPRFAIGLGSGWGGWGTGGLFGSLFCGPGFNNFFFGNCFSPWNSWGFGGPFWG